MYINALSICNNLYLCMPGPHRDHQRVSDPLELNKLYLFGNKTWVLETEPRFSVRATSVLTTEPLSQTLGPILC